MAGLHFHILDVFAERRFSGNQLAVFRRAGGLSSEQMQSLAREMHFSESTFILSDEPQGGGFDVRIFTPGAEVPFAGHPTLGTAYVIRQALLGGAAASVTLNLKVGAIPVTFDDAGAPGGIAWMRQQPPEFGEPFDAARIAEVLGVDQDDIDVSYPIQAVSTGLPHVIVPMCNLASLRKIRIHAAGYEGLCQTPAGRSILAFCPEGYDERHQVSVRVFCEYFGVPEDPATGSGNGCLAAYLLRYRVLGGDALDIRAAQGYEIRRPSLLYLRASHRGEAIDVSVGGGVIPVAEGDFAE
ncbi:Trans-2,3-dihydro-3-hydroxyanthranilate isomerase [Phycisphaerae bacterium RAS1]|nr:Trans-2,3-dihydro-3-hydroxyanthranilate isomerase [Phycisphaerae bacterium RAS1]